MGIHHSPHTHTIPIPMGIPMGITIPTAALSFSDVALFMHILFLAGPNSHVLLYGLVSPNAGGIALGHMFSDFRYLVSSPRYL